MNGSFLRNFLQLPITSTLLDLQLFLSPLFWITLSLYTTIIRETKLLTRKNERQNYAFLYFKLYVLGVQKEDNQSESTDGRHSCNLICS